MMVPQFSGKERIVQAALILFAIATYIAIFFALNLVGAHSNRKKMLDSMGTCYFSSLQSEKNTATARETLASTLGPRLMAGYACTSESISPGTGDIVMIERPTAFPGDWVFAIYGDAQVKKISRGEAIEIVRKAEAAAKNRNTTPQPQ